MSRVLESVPRLTVVFLALRFGLCLPKTLQAQRLKAMSGCSGLQIFTSPSGVTQHAYTGSYNASFTVNNCGSTAVFAINLSCVSTGPVSCGGVSPTYRASLAAGASFSVTLTYSVGDPGIGQGQLWATWGDGPVGFGALGVTVDGPPLITLVPYETSFSRAVVHNRTPVIRALSISQNSAIDSTKTLLKWGNDTVTKWRADSLTVARWNRGLIEWEVDSVRGLNGSGADSVLITAKACAVNTMCTTVSRWAVLPADNAPLLGLTTTPLGTSTGFAAPFGPGISVSGAEIETGFSTIPYFSMGSPRSAGLIYFTRQSYPRVLVPLEIEWRWPAGNPTEMVVRLFDGAVKLDSLKLSNPTCSTGSARRCRVVLQGDFSGSTFPVPTRKWLRVEVAVTSGSTVTSTDSVEAVLVDRRQTAYGSGWWPSALFKVVSAGDDRVLVAPNGAWTVYRGNGDSLYLPPLGSFVFLKQTASGWELRARGDSAVTRFDIYGRVVASVDRNGNRDSLAYGVGGLDTLKKVRDATGHEITFAYTSNKLSTITDAAGRDTRITVNGTNNQLTYDSLSSPSSRSLISSYNYQAFGGTNTVLLIRRVGIQDTTTIVYDSTFKRRPRQAVLPTVRDPGGSLVNPTITYTPVESRGFGGVVRVDSAGPFVQMDDPRGNWTRSWLNRWGQARLTWDTLEILGRTVYQADGYVRYSEGKNGDSSRVYTAYDDQRRLVKTYIVRGALGNVLRTDSLVYNASHQVTQRVDSRGKISKLFPDARGNDTMTVSPNSDTTRYAFNANGQVFSVRAPGDTGKTRQYYDVTWLNLVRATTPHGDTVVNNTLDGAGRAVTSTRKMIVQTVDETPGTTGLQWRHTETFFTVANEVDSTRISRSDTCTGLTCTVPGSWSWDSVHSMRVGMRYDRNGKDSVRVTGANRETLCLYDRLGRVLVRRPPSDSVTAPRDSMVYDVAGNLVRAISRRGDTTVVFYDSRDRDTATVIPGVGTRRKVYLGPQDQLTRIWDASPVDSIGGVNGEVRFGYDSRGRLRADTAYQGSTAVATTHSYDTFERDSAMTDPLGASTFLYEANRGYLNQIYTALGDTLYYFYDKRGRATGPAVWRNGIKTKVGQIWNLDGALTGLVDSAWGTPYEIGRYSEKYVRDDASVARLPLWLQRKNSFPITQTDTLEDAPVYDGWERLTQWSQKKNGTQIASYAYSFDEYGNLYTPSGGQVYGAATDRLLRRTDAVTGHIWSYGYDRNGNQVSARDSTVGGSALVWTYGYNGQNQLVSVSRSGIGIVARYGYDVLGRRVVKRVYSSSTGGTQQYLRMVYHGGQVAFESDSGGATGWKYVWGLGTDRLLIAQNGANVYWISTDKLGSLKAVINPSWFQYQWHTPYAETTTTEGTSTGLRYAWTGREFDAETGQYFHRARYFAPNQRRFTQEDPAGTAGGENLFAYAAGGPLEASDPTELSPDGNHYRDCYPGECYHLPTPNAYMDVLFGGFLLHSATYVTVNGAVVLVIPVPYSEMVQRYGGTGSESMFTLDGPGGMINFQGPSSDQAACQANPVCSAVYALVDQGSAGVTVTQSSGTPGAVTPVFAGAANYNVVYGTPGRLATWAANAFANKVISKQFMNSTITLTHEFAHVLWLSSRTSVGSPREYESWAMIFENAARATNPAWGVRCGYYLPGDYDNLPSCH